MLTRGIWATICIAMLALSGCSDRLQDIDDATFHAISATLGKAELAARLCLNDATEVLPEHSGNCVAVARLRKQIPKFSKCHGEFERFPKCKSLVESYKRVLEMHWRAIAISLAREHDSAGYKFYLDEKAMARKLEDCMRSKRVKETTCVADGEDPWLHPV